MVSMRTLSFTLAPLMLLGTVACDTNVKGLNDRVAVLNGSVQALASEVGVLQGRLDEVESNAENLEMQLQDIR